MEGQQGAVAESADELEVLCSCFGVFPNPTDLAILAAGGTIREPSGEIGNVSVDGYRHASIISPRAALVSLEPVTASSKQIPGKVNQVSARCIGSYAEFLGGLVLAINPKCPIAERLGAGRVPSCKSSE